MGELQRMQDQPGYVSTWTPKTASGDDVPAVPPNMDRTEEGPEVPVSDDSAVPENSPAKKEALYQKLTYNDKDGRSEYSISNQHNGHTLDGFVVHRTFFNPQVGSLGRSLYDDGCWYTTSTAPGSLGLKQFATQEEALNLARRDAAERGLQVLAQPVENPEATSGVGTCHLDKTLEYVGGYHVPFESRNTQEQSHGMSM